MIELNGVTKTFDTVVAIDNIDLVIPGSETTILLGTSGCGKSTILRLIAGLIEPTAGRVSFDGTPVTSTNSQDLRQRIGFVLQEGGLFPHLTGFQNVALMAKYLGRPSAEIKSRVHELADMTHLPIAALDRYPSQLSGGQKQRLGLMRGLMLDPDVLLLDEPLGALDPITRAELQQELRDIFDRLNKTVVIVTHDLGEAAYLGKNIVLLQKGAIVQQGSMRDLLTQPKDNFVSTFVNAQRGPFEALFEISK